jgi:hypothetical protein
VIPLHDRVGLPAEQREALEAAVARQPTLAEVLRWGLAQTPPRVIAEVIIQDEFTHDVVLPWRGDLHLVYDTT